MPMDEKITQIVSTQTIDDTDLWLTVHNLATTPITKGKTGSLFKTWLKAYFDTLYPISGPQGFGDNYVITPSISTNNLVVAVKTLAGADPSASALMAFRIGNAKRILTSALTLTVTAGSSIFNLGAIEFAGLKNQLFVYMGWRAVSSTLFLGLSRIAHGATYADFSATSTNEFYLAYTGSAPASTDEVVCIGRIDVQNSGTASYNWSLPGGAYVVNRPIYETDWLTYAPIQSGFSAAPTATNYQYKMFGRCILWEHAQGTSGVSSATTFTQSLPFTCATSTNSVFPGVMGTTVDNGVLQGTPGRIFVLSGSNSLTLNKDTAGTGWSATGGKRSINSGFYQI